MDKSLLSVSQARTWRECSFKGMMQYIKKLELKNHSTDYFDVGSMFHQGMESAVLRASHLDRYDESVVEFAVGACQDYLRESILPHTDDPTKAEANYELAREMLEAYIPHIGLGDRYVAYKTHDGMYVVEYSFEVAVEGKGYRGKVDALLVDKQTGYLHAVDWKSTSSLDTDYSMDWQAPFYTTILSNLLDVNIDFYGYWMFLKSTPKPAEISAKTGQPLTGRASYNTTAEVWWDTLPTTVKNPTVYFAEIKDKLKTIDEFIRYEPIVFSDVMAEAMMSNIQATHAEISHVLKKAGDIRKHNGVTLSLDTVDAFPRVYNDSCVTCQYARICRMLMQSRDLDIVNIVLDTDYQPKKYR